MPVCNPSSQNNRVTGRQGNLVGTSGNFEICKHNWNPDGIVI